MAKNIGFMILGAIGLCACVMVAGFGLLILGAGSMASSIDEPRPTRTVRATRTTTEEATPAAKPTSQGLESEPTEEPVASIEPTTGPDNELPPLDQLTQAAQEITGDPNAEVGLDADGFLWIVYNIPENFETFYLATWRTQLRGLMPRLAAISPALDYTEVEITARGIVGGADAIIGLAAYDKPTVEEVEWEGLTNDVIIGLATRYNTNRQLE